MTHKLKINGKVVSRKEFFRKKAEPIVPTGLGTGSLAAYDVSKPLISEALGCHREDVESYRAFAKEHNIQGVDWNKEGQAVITSRRGRADLLHALGRVDKDGGYGDG